MIVARARSTIPLASIQPGSGKFLAMIKGEHHRHHTLDDEERDE
jgi:hypothetical protein